MAQLTRAVSIQARIEPLSANRLKEESYSLPASPPQILDDGLKNSDGLHNSVRHVLGH